MHWPSSGVARRGFSPIYIVYSYAEPLQVTNVFGAGTVACIGAH